MFRKFYIIISSLTAVALVAGCQQEITEIIEPPADQAFTKQSTVTELMQRTSLNDGSIDNIVDGASCTQLLLPVTISVNDVQITLQSYDDFSDVERIIDESDEDDDKIEFQFPVTLILADFTQMVFTNEDAMENFLDQCTEDAPDDDIECIDFKFPLTISIYNSDNQVSDVITINDDRSLYQFTDDLEDKEFAGFVFPITLILSDGTELSIRNNDELEDAIVNAEGTCDEDDDNDHDDDDVDDSGLVSTLTTGQWKISYFFDEKDETGDYTGYVLTFTSNGVVKAVKGATTITGSWTTNGDDGSLELNMIFGETEPFDELTEDWDILEYNAQTIKLNDVSGGDGSIEYLTFSRP